MECTGRGIILCLAIGEFFGIEGTPSVLVLTNDLRRGITMTKLGTEKERASLYQGVERAIIPESVMLDDYSSSSMLLYRPKPTRARKEPTNSIP